MAKNNKIKNPVTILETENNETIEKQIDLADFIGMLQNADDKNQIVVKGDLDLSKANKKDLEDLKNLTDLSRVTMSDGGKLILNRNMDIVPGFKFPKEVKQVKCEKPFSVFSIFANEDFAFPQNAKFYLTDNVFNAFLYSKNKGPKEIEDNVNLAEQVEAKSAKAGCIIYGQIKKDGKAETVTLADALDFYKKREEKKQELEETSAKTETVIKKETIAVKTDEYMSSDDFIEMVRAQNLIVGLDDDGLKRYFKMARSSKSSLKLETYEMQLEDGRTVKCIKKEHLKKIVEYIQEKQLDQQAKTLTKAAEGYQLNDENKTGKFQDKVVETNSSKTPKGKTQRNKAPRDYNKNKGSKQNNNSEKGEIKTIKIEKRVPERLMKRITRGKNINYSYAFTEIVKMNISPNRLYGPNENKEAVYYIDENNTKCALEGVKKEGSIICQDLPNSGKGRGDDRLYWYFLNVKPKNQTEEIATLIFLKQVNHNTHGSDLINEISKNLESATYDPEDNTFTYKFPRNTNETTIKLNECTDIDFLKVKNKDYAKLGGRIKNAINENGKKK